MLLFRGDRYDRPGSMAGLYRTDGIITKLTSNFAPAFVANPGLMEASRAHIAPGTDLERRYAETSSFLSFSTSRDIALTYAAGRRRDRLAACAPYDEDVVVFSVNIADARPAGSEGVHLLTYRCDYTLAQPPGPDPVDLLTAAAVSCEFCEQHGIVGAHHDHTLLLVDASKFLRSHRHHERFRDAVTNAQRDHEWLVSPLDYVERLRGFAARIPLSRIWEAERFKAVPIANDSLPDSFAAGGPAIEA